MKLTRQRPFRSIPASGAGLGFSLWVAMLLVGTWVAQAASPQAVTLTAKEFSFTTNAVTLTVGQPVQLTIVSICSESRGRFAERRSAHAFTASLLWQA